MSRNEFEARSRDLDHRVVALLRTRVDEAFTSLAVASELAALGIIHGMAEIEAALSRSVTRGVLEQINVDGELFYSYSNRLGFRPPKR